MNKYNVSLVYSFQQLYTKFVYLSPQQIISKLGNGAQGVVQLVEDKVTKEMCVVKKVGLY